mgnify:FL=1
MDQKESLEFLQQCIDGVKNWTPEDKERAKQLFEEINLENIKSGSQNPSDEYFEFILPNGETTR